MRIYNTCWTRNSY